MEEIRCKGTYRGKPCNRLLCMVDETKPFTIEIVCPKCGQKLFMAQSETFDMQQKPDYLKHLNIKLIK